MITVLYRKNNQSIFHNFYPILTSKYRGEFTFVTDLTHCLSGKDKNHYLVVAGIFKGRYNQREDNISLLKTLKSIYHRVVFWDESDGADSLHGELLPEVDIYLKKQILRDKSLYMKPAYGEQQFSDYYYRKYNVPDDRVLIREAVIDKIQLNKLHFSWNIGASIYPFSRVKRRIFNLTHDHIGLNRWNHLYRWVSGRTKTVDRGIRKPQIQARFGYRAYPNSIAYQRKLFLDKIKGSQTYLTGRITKNQFQKEMLKVSAVLSPFGFGEICHRDFEAIVSGAVVIKPEMNHIDTFPNVYIPDETYVPIQWNGEGLEEAESIVQNDELMSRIASSATNYYMEELKKNDDQVQKLIRLIQDC